MIIPCTNKLVDAEFQLVNESAPYIQHIVSKCGPCLSTHCKTETTPQRIPKRSRQQHPVRSTFGGVHCNFARLQRVNPAVDSAAFVFTI